MAAPDMSVFIPSMPSTGLTCRPPVSNVMPLPTSTTRGISAVAPAGTWSSWTRRGGVADPRPHGDQAAEPLPRELALVPDPHVEVALLRHGPGLPGQPGRGSWCSTVSSTGLARAAERVPGPRRRRPSRHPRCRRPRPRMPGASPPWVPLRVQRGEDQDASTAGLDVGREGLPSPQPPPRRAAPEIGRESRGRSRPRHCATRHPSRRRRPRGRPCARRAHRASGGWSSAPPPGAGRERREDVIGGRPSASMAARALVSPRASSAPTTATRAVPSGSLPPDWMAARAAPRSGSTLHEEVAGWRRTSTRGTGRPYRAGMPDTRRGPHRFRWGPRRGRVRRGSRQTFAVVDRGAQGAHLVGSHLDDESRPPPSRGMRRTMPRPSLVTSSGPSPVLGFIAAMAQIPSSPRRRLVRAAWCPTPRAGMLTHYPAVGAARRNPAQRTAVAHGGKEPHGVYTRRAAVHQKSPATTTTRTTATLRRQWGTTRSPFAVRIATEATRGGDREVEEEEAPHARDGAHDREHVQRVGERPGAGLDADPPAVATEHEGHVRAEQGDEDDDSRDTLALPGPLHPEHERPLVGALTPRRLHVEERRRGPPWPPRPRRARPHRSPRPPRA
jgi:hypothetical protein